MPITVQVPTALRADAGGEVEFSLTATSVRTALDALERRRPAVYRSVCDETGAVRRHIHLFVNNSRVSVTDGLDAKLASGDVLAIMTAVSGG